MPWSLRSESESAARAIPTGESDCMESVKMSANRDVRYYFTQDADRWRLTRSWKVLPDALGCFPEHWRFCLSLHSHADSSSQ